jgi:hypothetical protein
MGFLVDKMALERGFPLTLRFYLPNADTVES